MEPQRLDLQRRYPQFFEATRLPFENPGRAKLEMMRGLLVREFGKAVTEDTVQATVDSMSLDPVSVSSLLPSFLSMQRLISSMGQPQVDNERLLMKLFTKWLKNKYPQCLQALSTEYARHMQTQGLSLADVRSNNVLDEPAFALYEEVIRLLVKCTQQYDTAMINPIIGQALSRVPDGGGDGRRGPQRTTTSEYPADLRQGRTVGTSEHVLPGAPLRMARTQQ
jgi:hypothetical protein